jgi:WD40 repeat protein
LGSEDLKIWDAETGREIRTLEGHTDEVYGCAYSPDGTRVVSGSGDKTLKIWEAETGREIRTLEGHTDEVNGCAYSPDGARIVSGSSDCIFKIWDAEAGQEIHTIEGHAGGAWDFPNRATYPVTACAYSPDGARVVSAGSDRTLKIWDVETGRDILSLEGHTKEVNGCAYSPDGARVVSAGSDSTLKIWDAETGRDVLTLEGHTKGVNGCAYSPDGARVVSASDDNTIKIWDAETGESIASLRLLNSASSVAHHPHRASVACSDHSGFYLIDLVGITLYPLVITAVNLGNGPAVRCPVCFGSYVLDKDWLGRELDCPGNGCHARWRVNPFIAG